MDKLKLDDPSLLIQRALIAGTWRESANGRMIEVANPATGATIGSVPDCDAQDTRVAIEAAERAFGRWRFLAASERCAIIERWYALVIENLKDLARIMTLEQGKPLAEAEGEIRYAATFIKWYAEEGRRVGGYEIPAPEANRRIFARYEPIGVAAAITPWNFPAAAVTRKCAPALAAGCPVILKPSDLTPFTANALAELAIRAGIPEGVLSVLTGMPEAIGGELTSNPAVRKLSFTGSTRVGSLLMRQCADTVKKLSLELGGNSPLIVFDDADLDLAVAGTIASKFRNAGQTCVCANRILVQDGIYDAFTERLGQAVSAMKVGPGDAPDVQIGPLINRAAIDKVQRHVDDALAKGASIAAVASCSLDGRRYVAPVVLRGATPDMLVAQEETFGPVAPLFRFRDEEEAIMFANDTPFGLASYFFTEDHHRAWRVAERLEAGIVALNTGSMAMEMAPFGGVKQSGLGREGGEAGLQEYLELKTFHIAGLRGPER